jgi:subfamily B ATP-binding cassette protein MsbA
MAEIKKLLFLLKPRVWQMSAAGFFMAVVAVSTAGYAYLVGPVIKALFLNGQPPLERTPVISSGISQALSRFTDQLSSSSIWVIGFLVVGAAAVKGVAFFLQKVLVINAGQHILKELRQKMFDGMLVMNPLEKHMSAGNLVSRFTVDAQIVEQAVTAGVMAFVSSGLQALALASLVIMLSGELAVAGFIAFPPIAILISKLSRLLRKRQGDFYDAYSSLSSALEESRNGLFVIQSFGAAGYANKKFDFENEALRKKAVSALTTGSISSPLNEILGAGALGFTLFYAKMQIEDGLLTPASFISFFTALFLLYRPVKGFGNAVNAVQTGLAALERLEPVMHPVNRFASKRKVIEGLILDGLTAGYEPGEPVIKDISIELKKGERLSIIGESGCGKTTLLNVMGGYLEQEKGDILSGWPVAMVTQDSFLFDDTIFENVKCGRQSADRKEVVDACRDAGIMEFAKDMGGLDYVVGKSGSALSAGQRQRVALARALLSDAPVILLDEFTASLDGKTEALVMEKLDNRLASRTVVIVTHREAAARWAKRAVVIEDGKITADGLFEELVASHPEVRHLFGRKHEQ